MPTIITHAAAPLIMGLGLRPRYISRQLLIFCVICAVLPDFDVIGFKLGVAYGDAFGHRGASHSLAAALACGIAGFILRKQLKAGTMMAIILPFLAVLSHIITDMLTSGGLGVAMFWPFDSARHFLPVQPIRVSPFDPRHLLNMRGVMVAVTEFLYVWLPAIVVMIVTKVYTRRVKP
ncbi:MAG: metal-dependent hydrolase [Deferribacteraceae bacterium]|jgi:inner membrane protein|nr:metal-dependent hydrolase [Deferribacteraceae bacterium]